MTSAYARPYTLWGGGGVGGGNQVSAHLGEEYVIFLYFLGGKSCDAFVEPAFFLVGNRARNGVAIVVAFKTCLL